ncbi:MAG: di-heme oxidoredictase family protein, partial [Chitinophagaceae bacterium]
MKKAIIIFVMLAVAVACNKVLPGSPPDDELLDGPVDGLTGEQNQVFLRGDIAFNDEVFTTAT